MKRSRLSYDEWDKVILDKKLKIKYIDDNFFNLEEKDITLEQFKLANDTCEKLKNGPLSDIDTFKEYTLKCKQYVSN